jgi:uncharacterized protein YjbI with pentapeptide repeats
LRRADLTNADLRHAAFVSAALDGAKLNNCKLDGATLRQVLLVNVDVHGVTGISSVIATEVSVTRGGDTTVLSKEAFLAWLKEAGAAETA